MASSEIARYKDNSSPSFDLERSGGVLRYYLSSSKAIQHSSIHSKLFICLITLKKGRHLLVDREINLLRAAMRLAKRCTSFVVQGGYMSKMAQTFSGFASIPRHETMNPRNLPEATPKAHLARLSFILYFRRVWNVSAKSETCSTAFWLFTSMSSMYTSTLRPI